MRQPITSLSHPMHRSLTIFLVIVMIVSLAGCSSRKVKERPPGGSWEICPLCKGTGRAEIVSGVGGADDIHEMDEEEESFCATALGCLFIGWIVESEKKKPLRDDEASFGKLGEEYKDEMERDLPPRSNVRKVVRCPRCHGRGWIEVRGEKPLTPEERYHKYETFKRINEDINK